jgi:hypothetical protein
LGKQNPFVVEAKVYFVNRKEARDPQAQACNAKQNESSGGSLECIAKSASERYEKTG